MTITPVTEGIWRIESAGAGYVRGALRVSFKLSNGYESDGRVMSRDDWRDLQRALEAVLGPLPARRAQQEKTT